MLALDTSDDWTEIELTFDDGATPAQTWAPLAAENNARDAFDAVEAWFETRFAPDTAAWTYARDAPTAGATVTLTLSDTYTVTANTAAQEILGFPASSASTVHRGIVAGTWIPSHQIALRGFARGLTASGDASGVGAIRAGVPGLAARSPTLATSGSMLDATRLVDVLSTATTTRAGWLYQDQRSAWRRLAVGVVRTRTGGGKLYRVEAEVAA